MSDVTRVIAIERVLSLSVLQRTTRDALADALHALARIRHRTRPALLTAIRVTDLSGLCTALDAAAFDLVSELAAAGSDPHSDDHSIVAQKAVLDVVQAARTALRSDLVSASLRRGRSVQTTPTHTAPLNAPGGRS